jgi:hypothetical protein
MKRHILVLILVVAAAGAQAPAPDRLTDFEIAQRKILVLQGQVAQLKQQAAEAAQALAACQLTAAKAEFEAVPPRAVDLDNSILAAHGATGGNVVWDGIPHVVKAKGPAPPAEKKGQ